MARSIGRSLYQAQAGVILSFPDDARRLAELRRPEHLAVLYRERSLISGLPSGPATSPGQPGKAASAAHPPALTSPIRILS